MELHILFVAAVERSKKKNRKVATKIGEGEWVYYISNLGHHVQMAFARIPIGNFENKHDFPS
jgi:hypothetical protein